jgi:hypothetical protein
VAIVRAPADAAADLESPDKLPAVYPFGLMRRYEFENADDANAIHHAASVQECTLPIAKKYSRGLCAILGFLEEIMSRTVLWRLN